MAITYHQIIGGPDGITVVIGDGTHTLTLTEEEFDEVAVTFANVMEPIYAARAKVKREAEQAKAEAAYEAAQKTEEIAGHTARLQHRFQLRDGEVFSDDIVTFAWLDGYSRPDAPFVVEREAWGRGRPYVIKAEKYQYSASMVKRREVPGPNGGVMRFSTAQAAFKRAIELNLHKVEETTE